jgi:hypothetical protein
MGTGDLDFFSMSYKKIFKALSPTQSERDFDGQHKKWGKAGGSAIGIFSGREKRSAANRKSLFTGSASRL